MAQRFVRPGRRSSPPRGQERAGGLGRVDERSIARFYDDFAADSDLVYGGRWPEAVTRQAGALDRLIRGAVPHARAILDCSYGIGTQASGLARLGYQVVGTDISPRAVERACLEAQRAGVEAGFATADFRDLSGVPGTFDAVISCDNTLPHLLDPRELPLALGQMPSKLRPGGVLLVTMRDFDRALAERPPVAPPVVTHRAPRHVRVRPHD